MECRCCLSATETIPIKDSFKGNDLTRCKNCAQVQLQVNPTREEINDYYKRIYGAQRRTVVGPAYMEVMRRRAVAQWAYIVSMTGQDAMRDVVDIGSGFGAFLEHANEQAGVRCKGYEMDPVAHAYCRERRMDVELISSEEDYRKIRQCDLIVLSHTLEHMLSPDTSLAVLKARTKRLFIEVPTYCLDVPGLFDDQEGHLHFFNEVSLKVLLDRLGFSLVDAHRYGPSMNAWWRKDLFHKIVQHLLTRLHNDPFWNQYCRRNREGMWIRAFARTT